MKTVTTPATNVSAAPPVWIEVDLAAVRHNFQQVRRLVGPRQRLLTVVKANGYGHGLLAVAQTLIAAGADLLGVASVAEGVTLRQAGVGGKIFVMGQLLPEEAPLVAAHDLTQAVSDEPSARALAQAAQAQEKQVAIHLKVDTGMGRYGVWHEEADPLFERLLQMPALKVEGIFTHLSSAGQNPKATAEQLSFFRQVVDRLKQKGVPAGIRHAANSVGLLKFPESRWDLVRTGLLIYGVSPVKEGQPLELKPALSLKSRVRFLKRIPPGRTVSYGGAWKAERPSVIVTIPIGYAHGYSRDLSNQGKLLIRGRRAPVIGRVTMEDLMADATDIPGVAIGDEVVLIGRQGNETITAEELARQASTIPYEILVGLSPRIPRLYA